MRTSGPISRVVDVFGSASAALLIGGLIAFLLADLIVTFWFQ